MTFAELALPPAFIALVAFLLLTTFYTAFRSVKLRIKALGILTVFFGSSTAFFIAFVFRALGGPIPAVATTGLVQGIVFSGLAFFKQAFHIRSKRTFQVVLGVLIAIGVVNLVIASFQELAGFTDFARLGRTICGSIQLAIIASWQAIHGFVDWNKFRGTGIMSYVMTRYFLFGISGIVAITVSVIDLVGTTLDITGAAGYGTTIVALIFLTLAYCALNYFIWVMPGPVKRVINKLGKHEETAVNHSRQGVEHVYDIINFLGDKLAVLIEKTPSAAKGLLLVCLTQKMGEGKIHEMKREDLIDTVLTVVKRELEQLRVADVGKIVANLVNEIERDKSLFTIIPA